MNTIQALSSNAQAKRAALEVQTMAISTLDSMLKAWQMGMDKIWQCADPAATVAELGITATGMFALSSDLCELLEKYSPGCTAERLQLMANWAVTLHLDGTATIVRLPEPDPEPGDGESASDSLA
jgi:hypothetical protein